MKVDETKNDGPKLLKKYLQYALEVSKGEFAPALKENNAHRGDWYLKNKIKNLEFEQGINLEINEENIFFNNRSFVYDDLTFRL